MPVRSQAAPIFRWAGSKRKLVPILLSLVPQDFERYIEPFAGSACLFFALNPAQAILGDINQELLSTYDTIKTNPLQVVRFARALPNSTSMYYRVRALDPTKLDKILRAARFVYLNRFCFNGVYRVNRKGNFNVPRGNKTGDIPSETDFRRCAFRLRKAKLVVGDFQLCLNDVGSGDFVYLDPPYASTRRNTYGEYGYDTFNVSRLSELIESLRAIDKRGAHFLMSYSSNLADEPLPKNWHLKTVNVKRHIAGFADHRNTVKELLVSNRSFRTS